MAHSTGWNSVSDRSSEASTSSPIRWTTRSSTSITTNRKTEVLIVCHTTLHTGEPALQSQAVISHLDRFIGRRFVAAEHRVFEQIAADHRDREFDHEQQSNLPDARAARQHDGHRLVRRGEKNCDQRCRGEIAGAEQRRGGSGKAALRNRAGQRADDWTKLRRAREQGGGVGQPVLNIIEQRIDQQQERHGFQNIKKCFRHNVC